MIRIRQLLLVLVALLALLPLAAFTGSNPEIEALIVRVEHAHGVTFIRNGSEHTAIEAAAHMRRKLAAARGRIGSAEQFIDHIGTRSSLTGIAYRVRFADGRETDSATWLRQLLRELRAERVRSPRPAASAGPAPARAGR